MAERTLVSTKSVALEIAHITKEFPGVRALDDVSFPVIQGEVHGVVGENGAGKSTLMAIISGALQPTSGRVVFFGQSLQDLTAEQVRESGIAIVRQEPALLPDLTVAENIALTQTGSAHIDSRMEQNAEMALAVWGRPLAFKVTDRVEQLRPQQRFIVEICRAIAQAPKLLILDEPTEHLVSEEAQILFDHISRLKAAGTSIIYISHRIPEVKAVADRITVLRDGRAEGTYDARELTEDQIVDLIIGKRLGAYFPEKQQAEQPTEISLVLDGFQTAQLAPITQTFRAGEIIGLAGIEGNGQTDFLRALAGLEKSSGNLSLGGKSVRNMNPTKARGLGINFLSDDRSRESIFPNLSVGENITFRSLRRKFPSGIVATGRVRSTARELVNRMNVRTPSIDTPIESLSGGNQQKTVMGSALESGPTVILIAEPTQGVDVGAKSEIYEVLRSAADDGATIIISSSSALELSGLCDRVLVFSRGQVVEELDSTLEEITEEKITGAALKASTERIRVATAEKSRKFSLFLASQHGPPIVAAALITGLVTLGFLADGQMLSAANIRGVLALAVPLVLVSFGQLLVMLTGGIDLSVGPLMALVVVVASYYLAEDTTALTQATGWLFIFAIAVAVGVLNWVLIDVVKLSPIIATLATYMGVQSISFVLRPTPGGLISLTVIEPIGFSIPRIGVPVAFLLVVIAGLVLEWLLMRSRRGVNLRAIGSRPAVAATMGLKPRSVRLGAYVGCSLFAGLAGIAFMAQIGIGDANAGLSFTLLGITCVVIGGASVFGGRGSFVGALLGAVLIQVITSVSAFLKVSSDWQFYLVGFLTLGAVAMYSIARSRSRVGH